MISPAAIDIVQQLMGLVQGCDDIRSVDPTKVEAAKAQIDELGRLRGRALIYPMIPSGRGSGPFVELQDGSVKMDMICGIGVHLFGHGHPQLMLEGAKAAVKATTMQGTLMPGAEYAKVLKLLVENAAKVAHLGPEAQSKISAGWLSTCGTMANELALKILRQKKYPAYKVISFKNAFAGRSTAMQELTDEPKYREGQPTFDQFRHIDFFDATLSIDENIKRACGAIDAIVEKEPGKIAGLEFELIQGEGGGFRGAPREWWVALLSHARQLNLGIWFDEIQTFGRTGELFAFQRLGLGEYVDLVTLAKPLQAAAVLWTPEYQPKPGLIAGTFGGGTVSLALGIKIIEMLLEGGYFGPQGRIQKMERFILSDWEERRARLGAKYKLGPARVTGGMVAFEMLDGKAETIKKFLDRFFDNGVIGFSAGRDPVLVRFLPPMGVLTEEHWLKVMNIFEETLAEVAGGADVPGT
ncbi:MAG: aminotransferase class III-fold pyridoxal phosphate-dependent enzyme [Bdellovibrionales bacterium]|nr:aminotransferase class III-fold pyridoxal phosphate-dependent enzyme [Bdellovibrionales bacterium]